MSDKNTYAGACFCGAVELAVTGEPVAAGYRHGADRCARGAENPGRRRGNLVRGHLIAALLLAVLAGPAGAEEFWGRKIADQPAHFLFGYGSLINTASRDATAGKPVPAIPARLSAAFG